jgi:trehalose-phosphatase
MLELGELVSAIVALPRPLLVALDVDGTLAPIVEDPSRAAVPESTAALLSRLGAAPGVVLALVTGRDAPQLARMIRLPEAWRAVQHGAMVLAPGEPVPLDHDPAGNARLAALRRWAFQHALPRGALVEEKTGAIGVHVRELASRDPLAAAALLTEAREVALREGLYPRDGRAVLEAQIAPSDKGAALRALIARTGAASCVYAGDDVTDEPAIRFASEHGIGIFVRSPERPHPPSEARGMVDGPASLARLIDALGARLSSG